MVCTGGVHTVLVAHNLRTNRLSNLFIGSIGAATVEMSLATLHSLGQLFASQRDRAKAATSFEPQQDGFGPFWFRYR